MSYFSGTFPKKFFGSDDHRPSNKPEPLHNDFWDTLYKVWGRGPQASATPTVHRQLTLTVVLVVVRHAHPPAILNHQSCCQTLSGPLPQSYSTVVSRCDQICFIFWGVLPSAKRPLEGRAARGRPGNVWQLHRGRNARQQS